MSDEYILDGHTPKPASLEEWAKWFEHVGDQRVVAHTQVGDARVSTVFLGLDHRFGGVGDPILFETMIFGGPNADYQERYCTWNEAEIGHLKAVELARSVPAVAGKAE